MSYKDFIAYKNGIKKQLGEKCEICETDKNLIIHHVSYDPPTYQLLCKKCHIRIHKNYMINGKDIYPKDLYLRNGSLEILYALYLNIKDQKQLIKISKVSYSTAKKILKELEEEDLIKRIDNKTLPSRLSKPIYVLTKDGKIFIEKLVKLKVKKMKLPELTQIELGEPWKLGDDKQGIAIPVLQKEPIERNYVLHTEVEGKVVLEDTGGISKLRIKNNSEQNVFVRRGTMLKGNTQHRAVVSSIVASPLSTTTAEIKCIFASKGISGGAHFMHAGYAPRAVTSHLHENQSTVWSAVSSYSLSADLSSLEDVPHADYTYTVRSDDLTSKYEAVSDDTIIKALKNVPADMVNQIGIIILDIQGVQGVEIFDHPASWKELSKSVIRDYASILSKHVPEYYTFDMDRVKEFVTDFLIKLIGMKAEPVWEEHHAQTYQFENDELLGEYTLLEGETIHIYATRKEKGIPYKKQAPSVWGEPTFPWFDPTPYTPAPRRRYITTDDPAPYTVPATTADIDPSAEGMDGIMRFVTHKRGNETLQALYCDSKSFTEIETNTKMSPSTVSKALKEAEDLGLVEKAYREENGKSVYKLTELGKKVNPKKFKA